MRTNTATQTQEVDGAQKFILVFIDETAVNTKMVRLCRRHPSGDRLIPQAHWKTITFVLIAST